MIQIWIFRRNFHLNFRQANGLREVCIFIVNVHVKVWFKIALPIVAPKNELDFIKKLLEYDKHKSAIFKVICQKLKDHVWYFSEELLAMALIDEKILNKQKRAMTEVTHNKSGAEEYLKQHSKESFVTLAKSEIVNFLTKSMLHFFTIVKIISIFLQKPYKVSN